jgi:hypothetical protein
MQNDSKRLMMVAALMLSCLSQALRAQETEIPPVNSLVRVQTDADKGWRVGYVRSSDSEQLVLSSNRPLRTATSTTSPPNVRSIPFSTMQRLERSRGKHRRFESAVGGAILGVIGATLAIGTVGYFVTQCSDCEESGIGMLFGIFLGPPIGALFGAAVGVSKAPEVWVPVNIPARTGIKSRDDRQFLCEEDYPACSPRYTAFITCCAPQN